MIVWRAMSYEEFAIFNCGAPVVGRCMFRFSRNSFHGKGVCFFKNPSNCALWSSDKKYVICKFKIADELLVKGSGLYPDFSSDDWDDCKRIEEYFINEYSRDNAELLDYILASQYISGEDVISARGKKFHLYDEYF